MENCFRCYYCDTLLDMSYHKPYNDITLCVRCHPKYAEMCKGKPINKISIYKEDDDKDKPEKLKTYKKKR